MMRDALLFDLSSLPYSITTTVDARLISPVHCDTCQMIYAEDDVWAMWEEAIAQVDAVWLIAPETDGYLYRLTALAQKYEKCIIGSGLDAIEIFSSKLASYQLLEQAGLNTINTFLPSTWEQSHLSRWIAKPDDGAGCEETFYFEGVDSLQQWILTNQKVSTYVIQPYVEGDAASLACVMHHGKAKILSCNKQLISIQTNALVYQGCVVNGMREHWTLFEALANDVAQLQPSLTGYVGIDVIVSFSDTESSKITVVEINPRLTTSYVVLREATGSNPAALIMETLLHTNDCWPELKKNEILLEVTHA